jgi:hypothetical protein
MERRKVRDEADARESLAAARRAGVRLGVWARANGMDGRSLHAWKMNLERGSESRTRAVRRPASLVELVPTGTSSPARYALRRGDVTFEFGDDAREEMLQRVLAVLRAC